MKVLGPRDQASPGWPVGTGASWSSSTRTSMPGSGLPSVCHASCSGASGGTRACGGLSVEPYTGSTRRPWASARRTRSSGIGAPPHRKKRSAGSRSCCCASVASVSPRKTDAPMVQVVPSSAMMRTAASPLKTSSSDSVAPLVRFSTRPCMKPVACVTGEAMKQRSAASSPSAAATARSPKSKVLWVCTTPLGRDSVPEVNSTAAASSASPATARASGAAASASSKSMPTLRAPWPMTSASGAMPSSLRRRCRVSV